MQNHNPKQVVSPFSFAEPGKKVVESPLFFFEKEESQDMFAITKLTDSGKYVKGGMLFYKMFDVEIWADIEATIYVNLLEKSYTVKMNNSNKTIQPTNPETQQYVIFFYPTNQEESDCIWKSVEGRLNCYDLIKQEISSFMYDPETSFVLTGSVSLNDCLSVLEFCNYMKNSNFVEDDFDISYYKVDSSNEDDGE